MLPEGGLLLPSPAVFQWGTFWSGLNPDQRPGCGESVGVVNLEARLYQEIEAGQRPECKDIADCSASHARALLGPVESLAVRDAVV
jgi:hypothetical protein